MVPGTARQWVFEYGSRYVIPEPYKTLSYRYSTRLICWEPHSLRFQEPDVAVPLLCSIDFPHVAKPVYGRQDIFLALADSGCDLRSRQPRFLLNCLKNWFLE